MLLQYVSDLHIDNWPEHTPFTTFLTPSAPVLIIAGDICPVWNPLYARFISWCVRQWAHIILVAGNHEYESPADAPKTLDQTDQEIARITSMYGGAVVCLQAGASYTLPHSNIRFVGATLWSAVNPAIWQEVSEKKADYMHSYIQAPMGLRRTHPSDTTALHALHKAHLRSAIAPMSPTESVIVITHHLPSLELLEERYKGERLHTCYASADDDLFAPNVVAWICGHAHKAGIWKSPVGTTVFMNARGYNKKEELARTEDIYNPAATFFV